MSRDPFYSSKVWLEFRAAMLKLHPYCQVLGCHAKATQVDHVRSKRSGGAALSEHNSMCMCGTHHSQKTTSRDMRGRRNSRLGVRVIGCDENGKPLDPNHHWNKASRQ